MNVLLRLTALASLLCLQACVSTDDTRLPAGGGFNQAAVNAQIQSEKPGDYWIGRRYFKKDYRFWGYVRRPGQSWKTAQLVMINEQRKFVPDREAGTIGMDHNYEYILYGNFSGQKVYEPPSNRFLPEFVLTGYKLSSTNPPNIYATGRGNPYVATIEAPF